MVGGFGVLVDGVQQLYELFFTPGDGFGDVVFEVRVPAVFVYGALGDVVLRLEEHPKASNLLKSHIPAPPPAQPAGGSIR